MMENEAKITGNYEAIGNTWRQIVGFTMADAHAATEVKQITCNKQTGAAIKLLGDKAKFLTIIGPTPYSALVNLSTIRLDWVHVGEQCSYIRYLGAGAEAARGSLIYTATDEEKILLLFREIDAVNAVIDKLRNSLREVGS